MAFWNPINMWRTMQVIRGAVNELLDSFWAVAEVGVHIWRIVRLLRILWTGVDENNNILDAAGLENILREMERPRNERWRLRPVNRAIQHGVVDELDVPENN